MCPYVRIFERGPTAGNGIFEINTHKEIRSHGFDFRHVTLSRRIIVRLSPTYICFVLAVFYNIPPTIIIFKIGSCELYRSIVKMRSIAKHINYALVAFY